jgi:membrane protease YdiL (CAAX protease family)
LILIPVVLAPAAEELLPTLPTPGARDFGLFLQSDSGQAFLSGNWGWFALLVTGFIFNTVLGEELLFRGLLLPRVQGVFGRWDWARQRCPVRPLPPARAVGDSSDLRGRLRPVRV